MYWRRKASIERGATMAFGKIKVDTSILEEKLKIAHKHIGAMIEELEGICSECGSTDTEINTAYGDGGEMYYKVKICKVCDSSETIEAEPSP